MKNKTIKLPKLHVRAEFQPETIDRENRTIELVFSTGAKGRRSPWFGEPYFEELSLDPAHVRLDFLNSRAAPLLNTHGSWSLADIIGVVERAWLTPTDARAVVRFSDRPSVAEIWRDVENGIIRGVSVGYKVHRYVRIPPAEGEKLATLRAEDWEPKEISLVPIGFDDKAVTRSDEPDSDCLLVNMNAEDGEKESRMEPTTQTPAPAIDQKALKDEGKREERVRAEEIRKIVRSVKLSEAFADALVNGDKTVEQARAAVIDELAKRDSDVEIRAASRVEAGSQDETQTRRDGAESALLHRAMPASHTLTELGRTFRGMSMLRMAEEFVGPSARGMAPATLAARALSTSDFPLVLGNVAEKMLMNAYKVLAKTFEPFVAPGELTDYKPAYRYQVGDSPSLEEIKEGGEYTYGSFGEKAESTQLKDYGRMIRFTRQMLINDDLQAFQRLIQNFGSGAARLESKLVYTGVLVGNPTMGDGKALFHADHGNLGLAAAINETSLTAMEKLVMEQKTLDGEDFLNLVAKFMIVGTAKKVEAQKILAQITATKSGDVNPFKGTYDLIVDPRITGNKWFLACAPADIASIEIARLTGETGPVVDSKEGWSSDGLEVKCRHTVAVKAIEWKGIAYNPGA